MIIRRHACSTNDLSLAVRSATAISLVALFLVSLVPSASAHGDARPRDAAAAVGLANAWPMRAPLRPQATKLDRVENPSGAFCTVPLAPLANVSLDPPDLWKDRVWKFEFRRLPRGSQVFAGIPFFVIPPSQNQGLAGVTLFGGHYKEGPSGGGALIIGRKAAAIYVLHTASYENNNAGRLMANYAATYADGTRWEMPVRNEIELADFLDHANPGDDCVVAWSVKHPMFPYYYGVYVTRWVNPHPEKEIASFELRPSKGAAVVSVIGLTLGDSAPTLTPLKDVKPVERPLVVRGPKGRLELAIEDNGKPTAARVYAQGADGKFYQPFDGLNYKMFWRPDAFTYASGHLSLDVPAGKVKISVAKGFEYRPVKLDLDVAEGATVQRTIVLERWVNMPKLGWYSGEMHIHPFSQEPEDSAICLLGEDLHIANLLIFGEGFPKRYSGDQFFRGKPEKWPDATHVAYYNEEYRNNTYGHMCLIDLRSLVHPLMGSGSEYQIEDYPANASILDMTHKQRAFGSIAHMSIPPGVYAVPWEMSIDVALGKADSLDMDLGSFDRGKDRSLDLWYRLLDCGYRVPATCGTDSFLNMPSTNVPLGNIRTYGYVGKRFSYVRWVEAARRGRSFVTQGPALFLTVDGKMPGDTIRLKPGRNRIRVRAEAQSLYPLKRLEVIVNGRVAVWFGDGGASTETLAIKPAPASSDNTAERFVLDQVIELDGSDSAWIAARVQSESSEFFVHPSLAAHTNPIYCAGAAPLRSPPDARFFVKEIDGLIDWVEHKGVFHDPAHREEVKDLYRKARAIYEKQAGE